MKFQIREYFWYKLLPDSLVNLAIEISLFPGTHQICNTSDAFDRSVEYAIEILVVYNGATSH